MLGIMGCELTANLIELQGLGMDTMHEIEPQVALKANAITFINFNVTIFVRIYVLL